jgi:2-phosphoglycerate kinase
MKQVRKRDGQLEDFDRMKLYHSMVAAGLSEIEANGIADQVESWVMESEEVVATEQIKQKVIDALEIKHPEVMEKYKAYKKPE